MAQPHVEGQRLIIEAEFRLEGVPTDPSVIQCFVRSPAGVTTQLAYPSPDLSRLDLGLYEANVLADGPGTWTFRFIGSGAVEAVREVDASVSASKVL